MNKILRSTGKIVSEFGKRDGGAVTADWVVLTAGIVIFGSLAIGIYKGAVFNLSSAISDSIVSQAPDPSQTPWQ